MEGLNEPQRRAVLHRGGPLLVLAGAGSGKTRVITHRISELISSGAESPWSILAVTFTNKAAREMQTRLQSMVGGTADRLTVRTFHSFGAYVLRREAMHVGLSPNFLIYDDNDQLALARRAIREAGFDSGAFQPRDILRGLDAAKNAGESPYDDELDDHEEARDRRKVFRAYRRLLRAANAVDFGDLLSLTVELFRFNEEVRGAYQRRFRHVLVDEFQDTNPVQYELLNHLAPPPGTNLVVVGDDDQSIYRWRGAVVGNILDFPRRYPDSTVVKLEQNYRSDQIILDAANAVISKNPRRLDKKLWSAREGGAFLGLIDAGDEHQEAKEVGRRILDLLARGETPANEIAVFMRANAQSRVIENEFRLLRVPYVLVSGRSFYERAEVKDAVSYLRLMVNPRSDTDLLRIINTPTRGIGDTTVERLVDFAQASGVSVFEALGEAGRIPALGSAAIKRLTAFRELIAELATIGARSPDATSAVRALYARAGLIEAYETEGSEESLGRAENLRELLSATAEFDRQRGEPTTPFQPAPLPDGLHNAQGDLFSLQVEAPPPEQPGVEEPGVLSDELELPPLQSFLEQLSLLGEADGEDGASSGRVSVMTLHASKGLEFDAVFLTGLEDGVFPHRRSMSENSDPEELAEERRLCYVGFTRARHFLTLSFARCRTLFGELSFNPPSRFIGDVPIELFGDEAPEAREERRRPLLPPRPRRQTPGEITIDRSYSQESEQLPTGTRVSHSIFGEGVVVAVRGVGQDAKFTVDFYRAGRKLVIARFLATK